MDNRDLRTYIVAALLVVAVAAIVVAGGSGDVSTGDAAISLAVVLAAGAGMVALVLKAPQAAHLGAFALVFPGIFLAVQLRGGPASDAALLGFILAAMAGLFVWWLGEAGWRYPRADR